LKNEAILDSDVLDVFDHWMAVEDFTKQVFHIRESVVPVLGDDYADILIEVALEEAAKFQKGSDHSIGL
jgi:hypothetical protein